MATSKDVAKLAGVSHTTVSRAFRGDVKLRKETYDRVMAAARQLNYTPNYLASSLKKRRSQMIGFILGDASNPFFMGIAEELEAILEPLGYRLMIAFDRYDPEKQRKMMQMMIASQAEAVIFIPFENIPEPEYLRASAPRLIQLFRNPYHDLSYLGFDDNYGAYIGMKYLLEQGHRRILVMGGGDRRQGFLDACGESGAPLPVFFHDDGTGDPQKQVEEILLQKKPTAVFAVANWYGRQAYMTMRRLGLRFPEDISFLMFDDLQWTSMMAVDVVAQPIRTLAQALAEEAVSLIQDNALPGRTVFKPRLICRGSVRSLSGEERKEK